MYFPADNRRQPLGGIADLKYSYILHRLEPPGFERHARDKIRPGTKPADRHRFPLKILGFHYGWRRHETVDKFVDQRGENFERKAGHVRAYDFAGRAATELHFSRRHSLYDGGAAGYVNDLHVQACLLE